MAAGPCLLEGAHTGYLSKTTGSVLCKLGPCADWLVRMDRKLRLCSYQSGLDDTQVGSDLYWRVPPGCSTETLLSQCIFPWR